MSLTLLAFLQLVGKRWPYREKNDQRWHQTVLGSNVNGQKSCEYLLAFLVN